MRLFRVGFLWDRFLKVSRSKTVFYVYIISQFWYTFEINKYKNRIEPVGRLLDNTQIYLNARKCILFCKSRPRYNIVNKPANLTSENLFSSEVSVLSITKIYLGFILMLDFIELSVIQDLNVIIIQRQRVVARLFKVASSRKIKR